jgi:hypothetical protein
MPGLLLTRKPGNVVVLQKNEPNMNKIKNMEKQSMRTEWFSYVRKIRKKLSRGKGREPVTHRQAMSLASETWGAEKEKIVRKRKREKRKAEKVKAVIST